MTQKSKIRYTNIKLQYSDVAMIFDDIPTEFDQSNTGWSMKTSTIGRRFVRDLVKDKMQCQRWSIVKDRLKSLTKWVQMQSIFDCTRTRPFFL